MQPGVSFIEEIGGYRILNKLIMHVQPVHCTPKISLACPLQYLNSKGRYCVQSIGGLVPGSWLLITTLYLYNRLLLLVTWTSCIFWNPKQYSQSSEQGGVSSELTDVADKIRCMYAVNSFCLYVQTVYGICKT